MSQDEPSGPDLAGVIADANSAGLEHVVIGDFSVIFHGYVRATRDSDLLVPEGEEANETILRFLDWQTPNDCPMERSSRLTTSPMQSIVFRLNDAFATGPGAVARLDNLALTEHE